MSAQPVNASALAVANKIKKLICIFMG